MLRSRVDMDRKEFTWNSVEKQMLSSGGCRGIPPRVAVSLSK